VIPRPMPGSLCSQLTPHIQTFYQFMAPTSPGRLYQGSVSSHRGWKTVISSNTWMTFRMRLESPWWASLSLLVFLLSSLTTLRFMMSSVDCSTYMDWTLSTPTSKRWDDLTAYYLWSLNGHSILDNAEQCSCLGLKKGNACRLWNLDYCDY
jgi:hypothetical protein